MTSDDIGKLVLRLTLGILMLFHGLAKITHGIDFIIKTLAARGLPEYLAYGVYVGEVVAPILIIIGYFTRIGAAIIFANMVFALILVHTDHFWILGDHGGWRLELQAFFLLTALAVIQLGAGKLSVSKGRGPWD